MTEFIRQMKEERLAPRTINFYRETVHAVLAIFAADGRPTMPRQIRRDDVDYLLDYFSQHDYAVETRKGYIQALRRWCSAFDAPVLRTWPKIKYPIDKRPNVDWLSEDETMKLLAWPKTPLQETVIHLELCMGLRHVEVIRLKVDDIDWTCEFIRVLGKGPEGGSPRLVPFAAGTREILLRMIREREEMIRDALGTVPPNLILWRRRRFCHSYSEEGYGLDKRVTLPLSKELGFHFSNHTFRRTFGRAMFRASVPLPTIARILGHESTDVTLRYIGVDLDDMRDAMQKLHWR